MKSLAEQMRNHDREQMSRMAHNLPEQYQERAPVEQVAQVFNKLFNELRAAFPASMANFRTQDDLNEFRRQWLLAFQENGIHSMAQVDSGMRIARRQERPFLPSPGQFVAWCKQSGGTLGITVDQVITEYWDWRNRSFEFTYSEQFPWSQPVMYHICVELRHRSTERQLTMVSWHARRVICWTCGRSASPRVSLYRRYAGQLQHQLPNTGRRRSNCFRRSTTALSRMGCCDVV